MRYYAIVVDTGSIITGLSSVQGAATDIISSVAGDILGSIGDIFGGGSRRSKRRPPRIGGRSTIDLGSFVSNIVSDAAPSFSNVISAAESLTQSVPIPLSISPLPGAAIAGAQWCSVIDGVNDPGALDIDFDITIAPNGHLQTGWLKVKGINQTVISQASKFNNTRIKIYAGFVEGLPLATEQVPHQGLIADGKVLPCYGNWIGNDLSIEFIINPGIYDTGGPQSPKNIIHNMKAGTPLSSAIQSALGVAFPNYRIITNISNSLVLNYDDKGFYQSLEQYQNYVKELSHSILGTPNTTGYQGVAHYVQGDKIFAGDATVTAPPIQIQFDELIGQPTWGAGVGDQQGYTLSVKTVLRADIAPIGFNGNATITLPRNILVTTPTESASMFVGGAILQYQPGDVLDFQGTWTVTQVRHVGSFRQPTGEAWVTIISAIPTGIANTIQGGNVLNQSGNQSFVPLGQGGIGHA